MFPPPNLILSLDNLLLLSPDVVRLFKQQSFCLDLLVSKNFELVLNLRHLDLQLNLFALLLVKLKGGSPLSIISDFPKLKLEVINLILLEVVGLSDPL